MATPFDPDEELRKLYPNLTPEECEEAKEVLDQYLLLAWEIMEEADRETSSDTPKT